MDTETAREINPDKRVSKGLAYASPLAVVGAAAAAVVGRYALAAVILAAALLLYQVSQYRLAISALQRD
jgi:hypothetical protein